MNHASNALPKLYRKLPSFYCSISSILNFQLHNLYLKLFPFHLNPMKGKDPKLNPFLPPILQSTPPSLTPPPGVRLYLADVLKTDNPVCRQLVNKNIPSKFPVHLRCLQTVSNLDSKLVIRVLSKTPTLLIVGESPLPYSRLKYMLSTPISLILYSPHSSPQIFTINQFSHIF